MNLSSSTGKLKELWQFALPLIFSSLSSMAMLFVARLMLARFMLVHTML